MSLNPVKDSFEKQLRNVQSMFDEPELSDDELDAIDRIRDAAKTFVTVIYSELPHSAERSRCCNLAADLVSLAVRTIERHGRGVQGIPLKRDS
jgi:hypothetical protein